MTYSVTHDCEHFTEATNVSTIKRCPKQQHVDLTHFIAEIKDSGGKEISGADDKPP